MNTAISLFVTIYSEPPGIYMEFARFIVFIKKKLFLKWWLYLQYMSIFCNTYLGFIFKSCCGKPSVAKFRLMSHFLWEFRGWISILAIPEGNHAPRKLLDVIQCQCKVFCGSIWILKAASVVHGILWLLKWTRLLSYIYCNQEDKFFNLLKMRLKQMTLIETFQMILMMDLNNPMWIEMFLMSSFRLFGWVGITIMKLKDILSSFFCSSFSPAVCQWDNLCSW